MALEGNLRDFSSTEILQLVASQRKTGCLRVEDGARRRSVFVVDGRIVSTRDGETLADDSLYRFLRRIQRLPDDQLRAIANLKDESGRDLEDLLVQGGYIDAEELERLIERQILDDLLEMIEWSRGTYQFDADRRWPQPVLVRLSIEASLIEAARRADERKRFQDLFQDGRQVVSVRDLPDPDEEIADEESELFGIIDGQHTVTEVVSLAPLTDYEASEALQRMIEAGWIEFLGRREAEAAPPPPPTPSAAAAAAQRTGGSALSLPREALVAALALACIGGMAFAARFVAPERLHAAPASASASAFDDARVADVRFALEVYHREHDRYPASLDELAKQSWIDASRLTVQGRSFHYRLDPATGGYVLELPPNR